MNSQHSRTAMGENSVDTEEILLRFNRLIEELLHGRTRRETFQPWEVNLLLDMQDCRIEESAREGVLRRYQRAIQRQLERGGTVPMKLSQFWKQKAAAVQEAKAPRGKMSAAGRKRIAAATRKRWAEWRKKKAAAKK